MKSEKDLRVLEAAKTVFLRHGFRRVTMQDIADQAGISRPALYLILPNKEEVFKATIQLVTSEIMKAIREGLSARSTVEDKLRFAFEIWSVQTFQLMLNSPDAEDLFYCGQDFASDTLAQITSRFESLLVEILKPLADSVKPVLPAKQIAHLLAASTHGFKEEAKSVDEMRAMIHGLISLTIAALQPRSKPSRR